MASYVIPWDDLKASQKTVECINSAKPSSFVANGKRVHVTHLSSIARGNVDSEADIIFCCFPKVARLLRPDLPVCGDWDAVTRAGFTKEGFVISSGRHMSHRQIWQAISGGEV